MSDWEKVTVHDCCAVVEGKFPTITRPPHATNSLPVTNQCMLTGIPFELITLALYSYIITWA